MPTLDDLSDISPPISDNTGRLYVLFTIPFFVTATAYTARPLLLRLAVTAAVAGNLYLMLTMPDLMGHYPGFDPLIANFAFVSLLRVIDLYFLRDDSKLPNKKTESKEPATQKTKSTPDMTALEAFDYLLINHRLINTPYQVKFVPPFDSSNPRAVPTRRRFLVQQLQTLVMSYIGLDVLCNQPPPSSTALFSPRQEHFLSRLHEVTLDELTFRILTNLNLWASLYCLLHYLYALISLACVGSTLWQPRDFPPLIGRWADAYTVRNHWSRVWHQLFQRSYGASAAAITRAVLPRSWHRGLVARYLLNFLVFAISGFAHAVQPLGVRGGAAQVRRSVWYFPAQFGAIVAEDVVIAAYGRVSGRRGAPPPVWARYLGYFWVFAWHSYSAPIWVYPTLRRGGEGMMPYSLIQHGWLPEWRMSLTLWVGAYVAGKFL